RGGRVVSSVHAPATESECEQAEAEKCERAGLGHDDSVHSEQVDVRKPVQLERLGAAEGIGAGVVRSREFDDERIRIVLGSVAAAAEMEGQEQAVKAVPRILRYAPRARARGGLRIGEKPAVATVRNHILLHQSKAERCDIGVLKISRLRIAEASA